MAETEVKTAGDSVVDVENSQAETGPEPNIVFVGKNEPLTRINNGRTVIRLPKAETQATVEVDPDTKVKTYKGIPFYHKDASTIVQLFGMHYKHFKVKG